MTTTPTAADLANLPTHPVSIPDDLRAVLRGIHPDLSMVEQERARTHALLMLAHHATRTNEAADLELQSATGQTILAAADLVERVFVRLVAVQSAAKPGYASNGGAA